MKIEQAIRQKKFIDSFHKASVNLVYTAEWLNGRMKEILDEFGITHPQFNILRILAGAKGPISPSEIKEVMIFKSPDLTRLMDRLVSKELVDRVVCPTNRRKIDITITESGRGVLQAIKPKLEGLTNSTFQKNISQEEAEILSSLLDKLREE